MLALGASNVTVHSLALKRSARINAPEDLSLHAKSGETAAMMDYSIERLTQDGFEPYYLYRQTRMAGNLENTGWAKPGTIAVTTSIPWMSPTRSSPAVRGCLQAEGPVQRQAGRIFNFKTPTSTSPAIPRSFREGRCHRAL